MLFFLPLALSAPCEHPTRSQDLYETARLVEKAFADSDRVVLLERRDQLVVQLTCVGERLDEVTLGRVHCAQTLGAFVEARPEDLVGAPDDSRTMAAMAGLFDVEAGFQFPLDLPPEHSLRQLRTNAGFRLKEPAIVRLPSPGDGRIEANREPVTQLREQVAVVLQQYDKDNNLLATCYWWPGEGSACLQDLGPVPGPATVTPPANQKKVVPLVLGGASLLMLGTGGGMAIYNSIYWKNNLSDCMGPLPLFPGSYTGGACGFPVVGGRGSAEVAEDSFYGWKGSWLAGLGLMTAGGLGLIGSGVVVLTDGRQVVVTGSF